MRTEAPVSAGPATALVAVQAARQAAGRRVQHELRAPAVVLAAAASAGAAIGVSHFIAVRPARPEPGFHPQQQEGAFVLEGTGASISSSAPRAPSVKRSRAVVRFGEIPGQHRDSTLRAWPF